MLSPKVYWPLFYYLLLFFVSGSAFAVVCPNCKTDTLCCRNLNIVCSECNGRFYAEQFLPSGRRSLLEGGSVPTYEGGITVFGPLVSNHFNLSVLGVAPLQILSDEQVSHLVAYVQLLHPGVNTSPQFVFTALAAAHMTLLTEFFELPDVERYLVIWWLAGYWLLYQDRSTRSQAQLFLNDAPEALNISQAQQQINHLHRIMQNYQGIPELESLFFSGITLQASHALSVINHLASEASAPPLAFQVQDSGGVIFVAYIRGFYCIFTPFKCFYMVKRAETVAQVLARIANAYHITQSTAMTALQVGVLAFFGGTLGAIFGAPFAIASGLAGVDPQMVMTVYGAMITTVAIAFAAHQPHMFLSRGVLDDISEWPDTLEPPEPDIL